MDRRPMAPTPGNAIDDQPCFVHSNHTLRTLVLNEPRGVAFKQTNLLVPTKGTKASKGIVAINGDLALVAHRIDQ